MIIDSHTHTPRPQAVVNRAPDVLEQPGTLYSVGVHPWNADTCNSAALEEAVSSRQTVAVGETGLDSLRGPDIATQTRVFLLHAKLAEKYRKPLIIHCVKQLDAILALRRSLNPSQPWIMHGFRGKPQQAVQLLRAGFYISLGSRFNPDTARIIPLNRLLMETDDTDITIQEVAAAVASARGVSATEITESTAANWRSLLQK